MSTYNEYLHSDFKQLGFPDYIKMLDSELQLKDVSFLFTRQNLPDAPFFGKFNTEFRFAVVHPSEDSGKRPYISLIQSSLLDGNIEDHRLAILHTQLYYQPLPTRQAIKQDIIQSFEDHLRKNISALNRINPTNPAEELEILAAHVRKR